MLEDMNSLVKNKTWTLVPRPVDKFFVDNKWIYSAKEGNSEIAS